MSRGVLKILARLRMWWADIRGHHGKVWDYEPGDYYMGSHKGHKKHQKKKDNELHFNLKYAEKNKFNSINILIHQ